MARKPKGMVLYEVIRKSQERLKTGEKGPGSSKNDVIAFGSPRQKSADSWPPKAPGLGNALLRSQLARRLRVTVNPTKAKAKALLAVIVVILVAVMSIRFFTGSGENEDKLAVEVVKVAAEAENVIVEPANAEKEKELIDQTQVLAPVGDHTIVIMTYSKKKDLAPAKAFFDKKGVETKIEKRGDYYFLLTANRFMSPKREGTDGYYALRKIKQIGAEYQAPPDFETFGETPFQDAYGMKIR